MTANHADIEFKLVDSTKVRLVWEKPEYRAYMLRKGEWLSMKLGGTNPENLKQYILRKDSEAWMKSITT